MIIGIFHAGSGLGNQLHRYVMTKVLAMDKGVDFHMVRSELFKGQDFMKLDFGTNMALTRSDHNYHAVFNTVIEQGTGRTIVEPGTEFKFWYEKTNYYNPEINFVEDNTIIDGEFQDERYFGHRLKDIDQWLKVEPLEMPDDLCIINFRGGEYTVSPELFLPQEYWDRALALMRTKHPGIRFEVHTDDPTTAVEFFPDLKIIDTVPIQFIDYNQEWIAHKHSNVGLNWRSIRYAKHLILANSSFAIFPALLGDAEEIIAPRWWARYNTKTWCLPQNYYKRFTYI